MADENFNPGQWPEQKPSIGTGEGEAPLASPLPPKIDIRTMATDQKSIEESGSVMPRPYVPPPTVSQTKEKIFTTPQIDSTPTPPPPIPADFKTIKSKSKKKPFVLVFTLVLIIGAGVLGYFVVYPKFFKVAPPLTPVCGNGICENGEDASNCSGDCETPPPPPLASVCGNGLCETDESETNCSVDCQIAPPPPAPNPTNASLFKISPDAVINEGEPLPTNLPTGSIIKIQMSSFAKALEAFPESLQNVFSETEYDSFVFIDQNNTSAGGSVLKIKNPENLADTQQRWTETVENPQFYMTVALSGLGAGEPKIWKNGQTDGVSNRYLTFANPGFALNYGWFEDKVIITTSYNAFREALRRLR